MSGPAPRRILVANLHSARNAGDAALLEAAVQQLRQGFPGCEISLAMNDPEYVPAEPGVVVLPSLIAAARPYREGGGDRWRPLPLVSAVGTACLSTLGYRLSGGAWHCRRGRHADLMRAYAEADLVVSCPGNVLFTMGRVGLPFLFSALAMCQAVAMGKPLYVMPQTIGPLTRPHERQLVRRLLSRARLVFVREPTSEAFLTSLGLTAPLVRLVPDLAFAYVPPRDSHDGGVPAQLGLAAAVDGPRLGVTVINRILRRVPEETWHAYETAMAAAISGFLAGHGGHAFIFPQVTGPGHKEDDRVAAVRVKELTHDLRDRVSVIDQVLAPAALRTAYASMDLFLATRMHSAIFAMAAGVPTLAIEYLGKTEGMMAMAGMGEWVLRLEALSDVDLLSRLEALYARRAAVRQHLDAAIPQLASRAASVGRAIAEDMA